MFISTFMTKDVVTVEKKEDIARARLLMSHHRFRHLPVTLPDNTLVGIVSDRDIRSAMPSKYFNEHGPKVVDTVETTGVSVEEIMATDPVCISLSATIHDALLLIERKRVGAFPVVDESLKLKGIVSDRDLLNAFLDVMGIREPGALLGIVVDEKIEEMEHIIHALIAENIHFGSILVHRNWRPGKRAVFPYLFAKNVVNLKKKLRDMGYEILDPGEWYDDRRP
jgi:acetoin utilization protein AcuB